MVVTRKDVMGLVSLVGTAEFEWRVALDGSQFIKQVALLDSQGVI